MKANILIDPCPMPLALVVALIKSVFKRHVCSKNNNNGAYTATVGNHQCWQCHQQTQRDL